MKKGLHDSDLKKSLTFEEKVTVAWSYHVRGIDQHTLAAIYGVNGGRVAEACKAVKIALKNDKSE